MQIFFLLLHEIYILIHTKIMLYFLLHYKLKLKVIYVIVLVEDCLLMFCERELTFGFIKDTFQTEAGHLDMDL